MLKYSPYILLLLAVVSVVLQYKTYRASRADCGCKDQLADTGTGPVI